MYIPLTAVGYRPYQPLVVSLSRSRMALHASTGRYSYISQGRDVLVLHGWSAELHCHPLYLHCKEVQRTYRNECNPLFFNFSPSGVQSTPRQVLLLTSRICRLTTTRMSQIGWDAVGRSLVRKCAVLQELDPTINWPRLRLLLETPRKRISCLINK